MRCIPPVRLAALARGQLADQRAQKVRDHLRECAACRSSLERVESAQLAMRQVAQAPAPEPSAAGSARGEATIRWSRVSPSRPLWPWISGGLAITATAAGLLLFLQRAPKPQPIAQRPPSPAMAPESQSIEALLTVLGGRVDLTRDGHTQPLRVEDKLRAVDALVTHADSRVAAEWADGSGFLLLADAQLSLEQMDRKTQRLRLQRGQVDVRVGPRQPGELMRVQSNAHLVTVHGTWFTVAAAGERTTVEVFEGVVEVSELDGSASTVLHAPARAVFGRGGRVSSGPLDARETARGKQKSELNLLAMGEESGVFTIGTEPAGSVAVDGVELGGAPLIVRRPLGKHYVEVSRLRYQPLQKWITVGAEPGELAVALVKASAPAPDDEPVAIEELVRQRSRQVRSCYEHGLKRDPSLAGTVSLKLHVGAAGQVTQARVEPSTSTLGDAQVQSCLEHEASTWRFTTGKNATVVYPFVFRPE